MACSECATCALAAGCLAGHYDDDYEPASFEQVLDRLNKGMFSSSRQKMIKFLWTNYHFDYKTGRHIR